MGPMNSKSSTDNGAFAGLSRAEIEAIITEEEEHFTEVDEAVRAVDNAVGYFEAAVKVDSIHRVRVQLRQADPEVLLLAEHGRDEVTAYDIYGFSRPRILVDNIATDLDPEIHPALYRALGHIYMYSRPDRGDCPCCVENMDDAD